MSARYETHPCACSFAKTVGDKSPFNFPRIGLVDNVLYKGHWLIKHTGTGKESVIWRPGAPALHAEADKCCHGWFDEAAEK